MEVGPFITWDFQDDAFRAILDSIECRCKEDVRVHQHDLFIEKSREMGASWMCLIVMLWMWLFHRRKKFLCISRNEEAVDDEDPDSLFWKLDFMIEHLPSWMVPEYKRTRRYFGNLDNGSTITGQASTGKAGVGGRATAMFIDEFSQIKEDFEVLHRTSDTTGCRIFNGTHRGEGTAFHELSQRHDMRKLIMHWSQHPRKKLGLYRWNQVDARIDVLDKSFQYPDDFNFVHSELPTGGPFPGLRSPWYDRECGRKGSSRAVAMDLDIDPAGSVAQFFHGQLIRVLSAAYACDPYWEGDVIYDRDTGRPQGIVAIPNGPLKLWIRQRPDGSMPPSKYGIGADISTGSGATNSVLSIANQLGEKVGEYATPNVLPENLAPIAVALCWLFKDESGVPAKLCWETPGPGFSFGARVLDLGFLNIHYRESIINPLGGKPGQIPGWQSSVDSKRILLEDYRNALDRRWFINHSDLALRECLAYRYTGQGNVEHPHEDSRQGRDPTGARVNHGDRVIADALAWKMIKSLGFEESRRKEEQGVKVGSLAWRRSLHDNARQAQSTW